MRLVLRKGYGAYSSGTEVELETQPAKDYEFVTVSRWPIDNEIFDVPIDYLIERRPRTFTVPSPTRKERRQG